MQFDLPFANLRSDHYSLSQNHKVNNSRSIPSPQNEKWSDCKLANVWFKRIENCIFYICIIMRYSLNSNSDLEAKFWVLYNEARRYDKLTEQTAASCPVWVTAPITETCYGFWMGLVLNQPSGPVQTETAVVLHRHVAPTMQWETLFSTIGDDKCHC